MTPTFEELEEALTIDRLDLAEEALRYPLLFYHAGRGLAESESALASAKYKLEEVESELGREAVDNLSGRITVALKSDYVKDQPRWRKARRAYLAAKKETAEWQALVDAWRQKSYQIRVLADLQIHEMESNDIGAGTRTARRRIRRASEN